MSQCAWCGRPFTPKNNGGEPQRYCARADRKCGNELRAALIAWAEEQLTEGRVTTAELKAALIQKQARASGARGRNT
jgi:hypothetical protein